MASCRVCDLRALVAIVCGLLTTIVLGLSVWRVIVRIQRGTSVPSTSTPIGYCSNGGTWENGRCICTEEWKGLSCTRANFCENSTYGDFTFPRIIAGRYGSSFQICGKNTLNAGKPRATRLCNLNEDKEMVLENVTIGSCDINLESLEKQIDEISTSSSNISVEAQILTSNTSMLTPDNITSASRVVGQIFNTSRNATPEAKVVAVTTVSQLLDATEEVFKEAAAKDDNAFTTLIREIEDYSWSLGNNKSLVNPNIAVQSITVSSEGTVGSTGVLFTVKKGASSSLVSGSTEVDTNVDSLRPDDTTELQIWLNTSKSNTTSCGFIMYQNNKLFQSKTFTTKLNISQKIISSTTNNTEDNQSASVKILFRPQYNTKDFKVHSFACVYWNFTMNDWDTNGCYKDGQSDGFLHCCCNHTTNFAVLMSFKRNYKYPDPLDKLSTFGCALSITGLALTIIFQIVTRKVRKTSVTWVLVSLCTSMLIFNLLFVFGIENSNKNLDKRDINLTASNKNEVPTREIMDTSNAQCTAIAALLHYFLLVTFTWTGLSAAQLYFLLIRTMKPLPRHFTLYISLIGWGVPAVVVAMTLGIAFSQDPSQWELNYRQEEICWLAISERGDSSIESPLLWSFVLPVTIILISNVVILIIIIVKVLWKNNQNLTSTKKVSVLKKIFSTVSIAVVLGITWILAYFMLIGNDNVRVVFSYIFCLFNTTQGLQIFILYTVRTNVFQSRASRVLQSLLASAARARFRPAAAPLRLRARMYNMLRSLPALHERFRLLESFAGTEDEDTCVSDGQADASI